MQETAEMVSEQTTAFPEILDMLFRIYLLKIVNFLVKHDE